MSLADLFLRGVTRLPGGDGEPDGALILAFRRPERAPAAAPILRAVLAEGGTLVTLPQLGRSLSRGELAPGTVCATFDGDLACWSPALELLVAHDAGATLFALGAGVSQQPGLPDEVHGPLAGQPRLGIGALSELADAGVALGTLGMTGVPLVGLDPVRLRLEMFDAHRVLVEALGRAVPCLAYPGGATATVLVHMAASVGYRWACTTQPGLAGVADHPLLMPRLEPRDPAQAAALMRGAGHAVFAALARARRVRRWRLERGA